MMYSKDCFSINEANTKQKRIDEENEEKSKRQWMLDHYPNYDSLDLRQRYNVIKEYKNK